MVLSVNLVTLLGDDKNWQYIKEDPVLVKGRQCSLTSCKLFEGSSPYSWTSHSAKRSPVTLDFSPAIYNPTTKHRIMHKSILITAQIT